ncbi:MAG: hypothetical protein ULS35scaffold63_65 [Phage 33_17]|nr:MAG: hypothetical protein ULS35scaffold63_65 [Phage 33_17]
MSKNISYSIKKQFDSNNLLKILQEISVNHTVSLNAKGLFLVLINIDQAALTLNDLTSLSGAIKISNLVGAMKELVSTGYILVNRVRRLNGTLSGAELVIPRVPTRIDFLKEKEEKEKEEKEEKEEIKEKRSKKENKEEKEEKEEKEKEEKENLKKLKQKKFSVSHKEFKKIYDAFYPNKKIRSYPYEEMKIRVNRSVEQLGSIDDLIIQINNYLNYLAHPVAEWRKKKSFEAWINNASYFGNDWLEEKEQEIKRNQPIVIKTKAEIWAEKQKKLIEEQLKGHDND